jgi:hypothetical protein
MRQDGEGAPITTWSLSLTLLSQPSHGDWPALVPLVLERVRRWLAQPSAS